MQGLPVDELLLTRETEDQLADLAGNAMSTTVVGACIMAALVVGRKYLKQGDSTESYEEMKAGKCTNIQDVDESQSESENESDMEVEEPSMETSPEERISGEEQLTEKAVNLAATETYSLKQLLADADRSARLCLCEGRKDMTDRILNRCKDCGSSSCVKCGGRPEHNPEVIDLAAHPRLSPTEFTRALKPVLPMALQPTGISMELLKRVKDISDATIPLWDGWSAAVLRAAKEELRFVELKRQEIWVATYQSSTASLELLLHPKQPEWRLFAKPEESEPANSKLRKLLEEAPVARLVCKDNLFDGHFDFALPYPMDVTITIEGSEPVPSWEARLGLQGDEFKDKMVNSKLKISVPTKDVGKFDRNIAGTYVLLDKCGTANSALHKRLPEPGEDNLPPLFMLLDPSRCGPAEEDAFTFSISIRRYEYGEIRPIICSLNPSWRQSDLVGQQELRCRVS